MDDMINRFWEKVDISSTCWNWTAGKTSDGYGRMRVNDKRILAHRLSYQLHNGDIPEGLQINHICRNRSCVNPEHLEVITQKENILLGIGPTAVNSRKTHCIYGHKFTPGNTYNRIGGGRRCQTCQAEYLKNYKPKQRTVSFNAYESKVSQHG